MITPWKTLRAHTVCSNDHLLKEEIKYLEHNFAVTNGCPKCFLEHTLESFESPRVIIQVTDNSQQNRKAIKLNQSATLPTEYYQATTSLDLF